MSFHILRKIFSFLKYDDYKKMLFLNKNLYSYSFSCRESFNFNKCAEIPPLILMNLLNKSKYLKTLRLGPARYLKLKYFEEAFSTDLPKLAKLDLSHTRNLSKAFMQKFFNNC